MTQSPPSIGGSPRTPNQVELAEVLCEEMTAWWIIYENLSGFRLLGKGRIKERKPGKEGREKEGFAWR